MRYFHLTRQKYYCPTLNLDKLWTLVSQQTRDNFKKREDGKVPVIDVTRAVSLFVMLSKCSGNSDPCWNFPLTRKKRVTDALYLDAVASSGYVSSREML